MAEAVDVRRWLEADVDTSFAERLARDRQIGRSLQSGDDVGRYPGSDIERLHRWWLQVRSEPPAEGSVGTRLLRGVGLASALLFSGGLLSGLGIGSLAFAFDGSYPVNLLALLGIIVGIPGLLLLVTLILLLPGGVPGGVPGLAAARDAISVINPGRWVAAWLDRFSGLSLYGGFAANQSRFARWQLVVFSQWLAIGYFTGVLLAGWILVVVTDLAFGWSTTLKLDAAMVYGLFDSLALPWRGWLPDAAPDLALVEASRFYRLETDPVSSDRAVQLGQWWPFVLMTIIIWGLAPRLLLLVAGSWRRAAAARVMFLQDPEVVALLDRLAVPHVGFGADQGPVPIDTVAAAPAPPLLTNGEGSGVVLWNNALTVPAAEAWLERYLGLAGGPVVRVGVWMQEAELRAQLAPLTNLARDLKRLIIITKGWEPPLLEFADFLVALRASFDPGVTITVVPINTRGDRVDAVDREVWAGFLARHPDPRLYVLQASDAAVAAQTNAP